eukprot:gnl/TRDRNA2_/TRDRNA2_172858_c1_seq10.p1 gnl/TRDRNA2_/TRDRNA2_172858_c1~~gnl/TRDRNA2_/TRDRNA2_172858_c1_seq10.p1  ORF type:complete len:260 (+),score=67.43 gnl/TRDRNA2_/TRDRNA2_172858_c1_seq10:390-1169(+)
MIMQVYKDHPLFLAFVLARVACAVRVNQREKALKLCNIARNKVTVKKSVHTLANVPERSVLSYIDRNVAVCSAIDKEWEAASEMFQAALVALPMNATAHYLQGYVNQERKRLPVAIDHMLKAIALDPDFKSPYIGLGSCYIARGQGTDYEDALFVSQCCLRRHPDAPAAEFNIGQAVYFILFDRREGDSHLPGSNVFEEEDELLRKQGLASFHIAKTRVKDQWNTIDERMLQFLEADEARRKTMLRQSPHIWNIYGWRP